MSEYKPKSNLLDNHIIMVTGAGDGIGAAVAMELAAYGATVVLLGRTQKKLEAVYDRIEKAGYPQPAIYPLEMQTAIQKDYTILAKTLLKEFGRLDGILHNAAVLGTLTPLEHFDLRLWNHILHVNLTAPLLLTNACLPLLKKANSASIIFTTANVGFKGQAYWGAYAISKAGCSNLAEIMAEELEVNTNIRVNSIDPGTVKTRMHSLAYPGDNATNIPLPGDITTVYLYLLGSDSEGVTGERFHAQEF
ncbi:MAG: YciK family oxidoreductase [Thiohalomonadales bacterium]